MIKQMLSIIAISLIAGCAKSPSSIAPVAVASSEYADFSCQQLQVEMMTNETELNDAIRRQNNAQAADALGVFLVLIPVSALTGDAESDVALNKGEKIAIERELDRRCRGNASVPIQG